ncbi:type II membrane protein [Dispira parvispora]|uniref:Autophagy-related protein 27 n=1 Tax=Dispira parvispora TaxID=1520584 RepID=A0A9W8AYA5_9FUNG|nr:type II membrane protein [Dispira parvispora]
MPTLAVITQWALLGALLTATPLQAFDCKNIQLKDKLFDLSALDRQHVIDVSLDTPPTKTIEKYTINPCQALKPDDKVDKEDQCEADTFVCKTVTNIKHDQPRVTRVQIISGGSDQKPVVELAKESDEHPQLLWTMKGPVVDKLNFRTDITFICDSQAGTVTSDPQMVSMDQGVLKLEWKTASVCTFSKVDPEKPKTPDSDSPDKDKKPSDEQPAPSDEGGSVIGTIFKIFAILLSIYFVVGIVYNYAIAGLGGLDLIPHRHFWQELPYIVTDFVQYVYASCSGRRRGGYSAV